MTHKVRIIIFMVLSIMCALPSYAIKWGVEGGLDFNKISFSKGYYNPNNRSGWFVGPKAKLQIPIIGLSFDGAFLYNQKGLSYDDAQGQTCSKTLPYFVAPVNLRYGFNVMRLLGVYMATGPQWNWFVGQSRSIPGYQDGELRRSSFSWNVGLGIELFRHLQVGVSYNVALTDIGRATLTPQPDYQSMVDVSNNSVQLRAAYFF